MKPKARPTLARADPLHERSFSYSTGTGSHVTDVNGSDVNPPMQLSDLGEGYAFPEDYMCGPLMIYISLFTCFRHT